MLRVKAVVSGMSVSLKGNASARKAWKMLEGHVQVCFEINTIIIIRFKAGFTLMTCWSLTRQYRIYSINRPGRLLNSSGPLGWALILGERLLNFTIFSKCCMFILPRNNEW